jgi:hypothetical protein
MRLVGKIWAERGVGLEWACRFCAGGARRGASWIVGRKTSPEKIDQVVQAGAAGLPASVIAQETELAERTVRGLLRKHGAAVNILRDLKRDVLLSVWQRFFLEAVEAVEDSHVGRPAARGDRDGHSDGEDAPARRPADADCGRYP